MANCNSSIDINDEKIKDLTDSLIIEYDELKYKLLKRLLHHYYSSCPDINTKINDYLIYKNISIEQSPAARPPPAPAARPAVAPAARPPAPAPPAKPAAASAAPPAKPAAASAASAAPPPAPPAKPAAARPPPAPEITTAPVIITPSPSLRSVSLRSASLRSASSRPASSRRILQNLKEPTTVGVIPGPTKELNKLSGKRLELRKKLLPCDSLNNDKEYYNLRNLDNSSSTDNDIPFKVPLIDLANGFYTKNSKLFQDYCHITSHGHGLKLKRTFEQIYKNDDKYLLKNIENIKMIMDNIDKNISLIKSKINSKLSINDEKIKAKYTHLLFINSEIQRNFNKIYSIQKINTDNYDCKQNIIKLKQYIIIDILQSYFLDLYQIDIISNFNEFLNLYLGSELNKNQEIIILIDKIINVLKIYNNDNSKIYNLVQDHIKYYFNDSANPENILSKFVEIINEYGDDNTLIQQLSDNIYNYLTKKTPINRIINILETEYKKEAIYNIEKGIYDLFYSNYTVHSIKYTVNGKNHEANYSDYNDEIKRVLDIDNDNVNDEQLFKSLITKECVYKKIYDILNKEHTKEDEIFIINDKEIKDILPSICKQLKEYNSYYNALQNIDYTKLDKMDIKYPCYYANELKNFGKLKIFKKFFYNIDILDIDEYTKNILETVLKKIGVIYDDIINNLKKIMISDILFSFIITYIQNKLMYNISEIFLKIGLEYTNPSKKEQNCVNIVTIKDSKTINNTIHIYIKKTLKLIDKILDDKKRTKYIQKKLKDNRDHINNVISMFDVFLTDTNNYNKPTNSFEESRISTLQIEYNSSFKLNLEYIKIKLTEFREKLPKQSRMSKLTSNIPNIPKILRWKKTGGKKVSLVKTKERIVVRYENKKYKRNILIRKNKKYVKINNKYIRLI
jgi:hypothetical protein